MVKTLADFVHEARARIREISVEEFDEMIENHDGVLVVDVREPEEFHRGHFHRCAPASLESRCHFPGTSTQRD